MSFVTPFIHSVLEKGICAQSLGSKQKTCGDSEQENDLAKGEKKENIHIYINQKRRKLASVGWSWPGWDGRRAILLSTLVGCKAL